MAGDRKFYMQKGSTYIEKQVNFVQGNQVFGRESEAEEVAEKKELTDDRLRDLINTIIPKITQNRHWFCVGKVLMLRGVIAYDDFDALKELLERLYPAGFPNKFEPADLRRLHDGCFRLPLKDWEITTSPFKRAAEFKAYYNLATEFDALFDQ